jgi:hypothetical protein
VKHGQHHSVVHADFGHGRKVTPSLVRQGSNRQQLVLNQQTWENIGMPQLKKNMMWLLDVDGFMISFS